MSDDNIIDITHLLKQKQNSIKVPVIEKRILYIDLNNTNMIPNEITDDTPIMDIIEVIVKQYSTSLHIPHMDVTLPKLTLLTSPIGNDISSPPEIPSLNKNNYLINDVEDMTNLGISDLPDPDS